MHRLMSVGRYGGGAGGGEAAQHVLILGGLDVFAV